MEERLQDRRFSTYMLFQNAPLEEVSKPVEEESKDVEEPEELEREDSPMDLVEVEPIEETIEDEPIQEPEETPVEVNLVEVERQDFVEEKIEEPKQEIQVEPVKETIPPRQPSDSAKEIADTIQQALFKTVSENANRGKSKQNKLKEYKITEEQVRFAEFIMLDGVICKDRADMSKTKGNLDKINMAEHSVIIGVNGHILYTAIGQVAKVQKPKLRLPKDKQYRT